MNSKAKETLENKSTLVPHEASQMQSQHIPTSPFIDNRPQAIAQGNLQKIANNSPRIKQLKGLQEIANSSTQAKQVAQLQAVAKKNNTGLPDNLKTGIEALSGITMDDVKVYRNSSKPAQLQAHAYAQGTDIHLASGQEKHLPHEAWHVVQQKQGRVKPTLQMKGKLLINDDAALEKEADVMGAKALQLKSSDLHNVLPVNSSGENLKNATATVQQVVQRYTEAHGHRIANDHTAAVKIGKNNKLLYATQGKINASNQVLTNKRMPLTLNAGAQKNGLVNDQVLLTVTPQFSHKVSNQIPEQVTPKADVTHGILLPSECEKGAIAIVGAFTKTNKSVGNTRNYEDKDHYNARIGELLAQSTAGGATKTGWYNDWVELQGGVNKAENAWSRNQYTAVSMNQMFNALNDAALRNEFNSNFQINQSQTAYTSSYIFNAATKARALFEKIIRRFDRKMTDIETEVMKTVATGTHGEQAELVTAANLRTQLTNFFANRDYDKAAIDQAINLVPQSLQLLQSLNDGFEANQAGNKYVSTATWFKDSKLAALAKSVLESIDEHVVALTARNTKSLQNGSGLNAEVNPEIGQSYGMIGGQYNFRDDGRWNWHWASVIMKTNEDNVTMEAHATHKVGNESHNEHWDFKMYGTLTDSNQTFHDEWKGQGFGNAPVTVLGVARDTPLYHNLVNLKGLTGLNALQTTQAINCVDTFVQFLNPLKDMGNSNAQLVLAYQQGVPNINHLPINFRTNSIQAELGKLNLAMQVLVNGVGTQEHQDEKAFEVNETAMNLVKALNDFKLVAQHYEATKRKREHLHENFRNDSILQFMNPYYSRNMN